MPEFNPALPSRTRDGRFVAEFVSKRRFNRGYVFRLVGYAKAHPGNNSDNELFAFHPDGRLTRAGEHEFDLVNYVNGG